MGRTVHRCFLISLLLWSNSAVGQIQQPQATPDQAEEETTPLMRAAGEGRVDEVRRLIKTGADVNEEKSIGLTALMVAAAAGHIDIIKVLLAAGADPNAIGGLGHPRAILSVLKLAMHPRNRNRLEVLDVLIAGGAKINPPPGSPESPLDYAVEQKDLGLIKELLKRGADVNWENPIGSTALVNAIIDGNRPDVDVVKLLLDAGADPNKPRLWSGDDCVSILTALDGSLRTSKDKARVKVRELLIKHGAKKHRVRVRSYENPCKSEVRPHI